MKPEIHWVHGMDPPGRLALMPRLWAGDWLEDEIAGWRAAGLDVILSLLEAGEIRELGLEQEAELCRAAGMEFLSFPIPDRGTPESVRSAADLVDRLVHALRPGNALGIHCRAGIGRTSLLAGCVLLRLGVPMPQIFPLLSKARGLEVPDTTAQVEWLALFDRASLPAAG